MYWAGDTVLTLRSSASQRTKPEAIVTHSGGATIDGTFLIMDYPQTIELSQNTGKAVVVAVHMEELDHCTVTQQQ